MRAPHHPAAAGALLAALAGSLLAGCQSGPPPRAASSSIDSEIKAALAQRPVPKLPERIGAALLPPLAQDLPRPAAVPEQRFDLAVNSASVQQVFHAMASGSRYSIIVPPGLTGSVTLNLKDVTVREALDVLREMHGFEYRIEGNRVFIQAPALQTRLFQVSYPSARRNGRSDTKVISGSISSNLAATAGSSGGISSSSSEGSQVSTATDADFWKELDTSLKALIGTDGGRQIVLSQHTGTIVVKAFPREQREIENFLRASRLAIERQVMLEAKIVEVSLKEGFESGINWGGLTQGNHRFSVGANADRINVPGSIGTQYGIQPGSISTGVDPSTIPPTVNPTTLGQLINSPFASGGAGMLGLAFTTNSFNGLLAFLETQGSVHVLSSPRVAAVNNQKAVLRVGTDDFYITNISTTTVASASGSVTTPTITVQPFFSGIALDVTPQIDEDGMVTMHVRPSVSEVTERSRIVNLGNLGNFTLPLASSNVNETDTVVRVQDGYIVAIGGLMQQRQIEDKAQVPGAGDVPMAGHLFKRTNRTLEKRELVFLIKPTVIKGDAQWRQDLAATDARLRQLDEPRAARTLEPPPARE
jgi:MSHA biogenesis protein MshL